MSVPRKLFLLCVSMSMLHFIVSITESIHEYAPLSIPIWFSYYHYHSNKYFSNFRVYLFLLQVLFRSLDDRTKYFENQLMEWDRRVWVHFEIQPLGYFHISWKWLLLPFISVMIGFADWVHPLIGILQKFIRAPEQLLASSWNSIIGYFHISWKIFLSN